MFFGMTERIAGISVKEFTKYLIIRMRGVPSLDAPGMNALENLYDYCTAHGGAEGDADVERGGIGRERHQSCSILRLQIVRFQGG